MQPLSRRQFLQTGTAALSASLLAPHPLRSQLAGLRPFQSAAVSVANPRNRVPLSFIIDDSTCLVNLAHYCIPQFAEVFPDRYKQRWRSLPREIPDDFVRKFADWCEEHGVRGKYSVVPYPACVGWIDREMPGWSRRELVESLKLVRERLLPHWDIHPEMVTHTWIINTETGRPYPERSEYFMENWRWTDGRSVDELANYMVYALQLLKNAGLPCEGITTPGGFASRVLPELSQATLQSCRSVFHAEIPHYFRHLYTDERSVAPRVEYASGLDSSDPQCVVSIIGCTGDWFGGWDGLSPGNIDRFITADLKSGRLPEVIARGEPAILVCHWPGIYFNGEEIGFKIFQEVVQRLEAAYDNLLWMKLSDIARYWAAKELTRLEIEEDTLTMEAPFACPNFTLQLNLTRIHRPRLIREGREEALNRIQDVRQLKAGDWVWTKEAAMLCFDLPKGRSILRLE